MPIEALHVLGVFMITLLLKTDNKAPRAVIIVDDLQMILQGAIKQIAD